jgi:hypothetical protein
MRKMRNVIIKKKKNWLENLKGGRPRCRCEDNIRMDLRGIRWKVVDSIHVVQDTDQWRALVNRIMNFLVS